ncbi:MAG: class I SAM-dependent methyltransferase [Saprospiraceae bacterium]|nr:class I SAM-dependent methyltransferase [Saprospiraceae bacterium]
MFKQLKYWFKKTFLGFKFDSSEYWEERYKQGGNSGAGSYNELAQFKADTINQFIKHHDIKSVLELGCGDGNQLALFEVQRYIGVDVSKTVIETCKGLFASDTSKSFYEYESYYRTAREPVDLTLSLDVLYHLTDEHMYLEYLNRLMASSKKYVLIYSSNHKSQPWETATHIRHHHFTKDISIHFSEWELKHRIKNPFPHTEFGNERGSVADFYWWEKVAQ